MVFSVGVSGLVRHQGLARGILGLPWRQNGPIVVCFDTRHPALKDAAESTTGRTYYKSNPGNKSVIR